MANRDVKVWISKETAETALLELNHLIDNTEDADPDPLTSGTFYARDELENVLGVA